MYFIYYKYNIIGSCHFKSNIWILKVWICFCILKFLLLACSNHILLISDLASWLTFHLAWRPSLMLVFDPIVPIIRGSTSDYFPTYWFEPCATPWDDLQCRVSDTFLTFNCMKALTTHLLKFDDGDTMCEICGGEARTTRILVRYNDKRLMTGPSFDMVADINLE